MDGSSFSLEFTSTTLPDSGEYTSEAALTDSTLPKESPADSSRPT
jgi:hypothetical protein